MTDGLVNLSVSAKYWEFVLAENCDNKPIMK